MLSPKDQLMMRLTGCTMDQLITCDNVPDSPRMASVSIGGRGMSSTFGGAMKAQKEGVVTTKDKAKALMDTLGDEMGLPSIAEEAELEDPVAPAKRQSVVYGMDGTIEGNSDYSDESSHASDFEVDPEHPKIIPIGITLCEAYLLIKGLLAGQRSRWNSWKQCVVGQRVTTSQRDRHLLAAAVMIDLYMRDQIEVHHWTMKEGSIAPVYKVSKKKGTPPMDHFLDKYLEYVEPIFRDMRLPKHIGEDIIWASLESRGILQNHRTSWERRFLQKANVNV
jgi:hypothetical protein